MGWGLDVHWAALAREHGWRCGVVDAVAIRHAPRPRPPPTRARRRVAEARAFLAERPYLSAREAARTADDPPPLVSARRHSRPTGRGRGRVLPEPARPGARHLGPPPGARRPRRRRRRAGARAAPAGAAARRAGGRRRRRRRGRSPSALREPRTQMRDGLEVTYVPYVSPPRERSYAGWGAWAAPALGARAAAARALVPLRADPRPQRRARRATPCRARGSGVPLVVSVHGGDVLYTARRGRGGAQAVARGLGAARAGARQQPGHRRAGARPRRRARRASCTSAPTCPVPAPRRGDHAPAGRPAGARSRRRRWSRSRTWSRASATPTCCARWRCSAPRHPTLRYTIIGDGPERIALEGLAARLGVAERVDFLGQLAPDEASRGALALHAVRDALHRGGLRRRLRRGDGRPGCRRSAAAASPARRRSPPPATASCWCRRATSSASRQRIDELLSDPHRLREAGQRARATVAANFTWERCGEQTLAAYRAGARVKPVLFVTGHVPAYRVGAFARLHERERIELALFGGRLAARRRAIPARAAVPAPRTCARTSCTRWPPAGATARSCAPPAGASRCSPRGPARAAPACR